MRVRVGNNGWYLCDRRDQPDHEYTEFGGTGTLALQWAQQLRGDAFASSTLRGLLGGTFPPKTDDQIAREVAWRLTSRIWMARKPVVKRLAAGGGELAPEPPPFPKEDRRPAPLPLPSAGPDAPVFPGDIDPEAIAAAQKRAAASGVPFCEECLRRQMATQ